MLINLSNDAEYESLEVGREVNAHQAPFWLTVTSKNNTTLQHTVVLMTWDEAMKLREQLTAALLDHAQAQYKKEIADGKG